MVGAGPGRVAFGPEDSVRLIFKTNRHKSDKKSDDKGTNNSKEGGMY
jgi:hypothetical protein